MNKLLPLLLTLLLAGAAPPGSGPIPVDEPPSLKRQWFQRVSADKVIVSEDELPPPTPIRPMPQGPQSAETPQPPAPAPMPPAPMPPAPAPMPTAPAPTPPTALPPTALPPTATPAKPAPPVERPFPIDKIGAGGQRAVRPDLDKMKRELERLKNEREALSQYNAHSVHHNDEPSNAVEKAKLQLRLTELLNKIGKASTKGSPLPPPGPSSWSQDSGPARSADKHKKKLTTPSVPYTPSDVPIDTLALGQSMMLSGDYAGALGALRQVNLQGAKAEERAPIQYLVATCLRKLGKTEEAVQIYREVAASKGDTFLAETAQWQLHSMNWKRDLESQIQDLRQRRQTLETTKP